MSSLPILKAHGSQNDIFLIEGVPGQYVADGDLPELVRRLCDRSGPLGGDGVYFIDTRPAVPEAIFFNPDGSFAKFCGNGMRCAGRFVLDAREAESVVIRAGDSEFTIRRADSTPEGVRQTTVELPRVDFTDEPVLSLARPHIDTPVAELHPDLALTALAVPNHHLVALIEKYDEDELIAVGQRIAAAKSLVPNGANLSFVLPLGPGEVFVQTYERGAGLTPSCGSGVVAARAVYSRLGHAEPGERITVRNPGGVAVAWLTGDESAWRASLSGNASYVYRAVVDTAVISADRSAMVEIDSQTTEIEAFAVLREQNLAALRAADVHPSVG